MESSHAQNLAITIEGNTTQEDALVCFEETVLTEQKGSVDSDGILCFFLLTHPPLNMKCLTNILESLFSLSMVCCI